MNGTTQAILALLDLALPASEYRLNLRDNYLEIYTITGLGQQKYLGYVSMHDDTIRLGALARVTNIPLQDPNAVAKIRQFVQQAQLYDAVDELAEMMKYDQPVY